MPSSGNPTWANGNVIEAVKLNNIETALTGSVAKTGDTMTGGLTISSGNLAVSAGRVTAGSQPGFRAYANLSTPLVAGTWKQVNFQTEVYDPLNNYDNKDDYTVPVTGRYLIQATVTFDGLAASNRYIADIRVNGAERQHGSDITATVGAGSLITLPLTAILNLTAGDVVSIWAYSAAATSVNASLNWLTTFAAQLLV